VSGGVAVLGVLVALAALGCGSREPEPEGAFYLRAEVNPVRMIDHPWYAPSRQGGHTVELWYRDAEHYRYEIAPHSALLDWDPHVLVADGKETIAYNPQVGQVHRDRVRLNSIQAMGGMPPNVGYGVGPILGSVEDFLDGLADGPVDLVGTEEMLGRTVEVYEYPRGNGTARYYIEPDAKFVLRHTTESSLGTWDAHVVEFDLDPQFDDERFEANVPDEAVLMPPVADCSTEGPVPGVFFPFPSGFIEFSYAPPPYELAGHDQQQGRGCETTYAWAAAGSGEGYIVVEQFAISPTGAPAFVDGLERIEVAGHEGYRQVEGDLERLAWVQDGVVVTMESNAEPFEELLRVAESGRVAP